MSVAYQSWEVGTGPKLYQRVLDGAPYRWQQHNHTESAKANLSVFSMYIHNSQESSETKLCGAQFSSPVPRHGECGPVSSFALPSCNGGERVPPIGRDTDAIHSGDRNGPKGVRNETSSKIHPHEHDFEDCDRTTVGLSKDSLILPTTSPLFQDPHGPALSSSSSSIGAGGDSLSSSDIGSQDTGDAEVQSVLRGPLNLTTLEDSLPLKRGLSRYFSGQSKSFGCLADALSTSLVKPANPYARRRKCSSIYDDRHRTFPPVSRTSASGISKKTSFGNRSNLALAVAMESTPARDDEEEDEDDDHPTPLPSMGWGKNKTKNNIGPLRCYSLSDLQGAVPTRTFSLSNLQSAGNH